MKSIEVGAFEAKTHFSQLLKEAEAGAVIHITRRGIPVAVLQAEKTGQRDNFHRTLDRIRSRRQQIAGRNIISTEDILSYRDEGRKQ